MPVRRCTVGGRKGWKWGNQGKCYKGKKGKRKANIQGYVIKKRTGKA